MSEATAPERTCMAVAKDMDKVKKALTKAEGQLSAVEKQIAALETKKKDAIDDIGDLDEKMDALKKEMEDVLNG